MLLKQYKLDYEVVMLDDKERLNLYQQIDNKFDILVDSMPLIFIDNDSTFLGGYAELEDYVRPTYDFEYF